MPIVFLTGHGDIPASVRAIKAGAEDFLSKPVTRELLLAAIGRALEREQEGRKDRERLEALRSLVATLTVRENEVFALVVRGRLNKQIAHELGTSERTVKAHRHSIMQKLRVQSLAELVQLAARLGLVAAPDRRGLTRQPRTFGSPPPHRLLQCGEDCPKGQYALDLPRA